MSEATAPDPAPPTNPDEPLAHDGPTFVHNGIIRFAMGDQIVRVRRPFLGELKALRLALADVQDAIAERSRATSTLGAEFVERGKEIARRFAAKEIDETERQLLTQELGAEDLRVARELDDWREQQMLDWWSDAVFAPLALDPVPDQLAWPMWMLDRTLPSKCLSHWRTVPTGPG